MDATPVGFAFVAFVAAAVAAVEAALAAFAALVTACIAKRSADIPALLLLFLVAAAAVFVVFKPMPGELVRREPLIVTLLLLGVLTFDRVVDMLR